MFFTVYKGYEIVSSGDNFRVKTPSGEYLPEVVASIETAKKWIDAIGSKQQMTKLSVKIPFSGFYESTHDAIFDSWLDYEQDVLMTEHDCTLEQVQELGEAFYRGINWKACHIAYAKEYLHQVENLIENESGLLIPIAWEEMTSPREYNFSTDCIYGSIALEHLQHMLKAVDAEAWRERVKDKCTSYDGFISFYSNDVDTWPDDLSEWGEARLGMLLELYIETLIAPDDINDRLSAYELMEDANCNGMIANWIWENASEDFKTLADSMRKD